MIQNLLTTAVVMILSGSQPNTITEKVVLKNKMEFTVATDQNGQPINPSNQNIKMESVSILIMPAKNLRQDLQPKTKEACLFRIKGELLIPGKFEVSISSPIDSTISKTFEVNGSGPFSFFCFEASQFPAAWTWLKEPGETWIPFVLKFTDVNSKETFEVTQWSRRAENQNKQALQMIEKIRSK